MPAFNMPYGQARGSSLPDLSMQEMPPPMFQGNQQGAGFFQNPMYSGNAPYGQYLKKQRPGFYPSTQGFPFRFAGTNAAMGPGYDQSLGQNSNVPPMGR